MKKSFSFVLMGLLGFSAAVGASSFGDSSIIQFNDIADGAPVHGSKEDGFVFGADTASFVSESAGDKAVFVTTTIDPFDATRLNSPARPFFSIYRDEFELFQFTSVTLDGSIFSLQDDVSGSAMFDVFGINANDDVVGASLSAFGKVAGSFDANLFGLSGVSLKSLSFSSSSSGKSLPLLPDGSAFGLSVDDIGVNLPSQVMAQASAFEPFVDGFEGETPSQVPVPASVLLLGSALFGTGMLARRKKKQFL